MNCRYCDLPVAESERATTHSYWQGLPFDCHKSCKDAGVKQEAFDCQVIDADCNDCKHFKRGKIRPIQISRYKNFRGEMVEVIFKPEIFDGHCLKFDRTTKAFPNKWSNLECFEHRRST